MLKHLFVGFLGGAVGVAIGVFSLLQAADQYPRTVNANDQERERFVGIVSAALVPEVAKGVLFGSIVGCTVASVIADRKPKKEQIINQWLDNMIASQALTPEEQLAAIELKSRILTTRSE